MKTQREKDYEYAIYCGKWMDREILRIGVVFFMLLFLAFICTLSLTWVGITSCWPLTLIGAPSSALFGYWLIGDIKIWIRDYRNKTIIK